jgi:hypothetical protein
LPACAVETGESRRENSTWVIAMISPLQNTSLPLEPARQQLTPPNPAITPPPQPLPVAEQPLPPSTPHKDKFAAKDGEQNNDDAMARRQQQQQNDVTRALGSAWARLTQLQQIARVALGSGDGPQAKEAAVEAASVAASLREMADSLPGFSVGSVDIATAIGNARSGVDAAMQVVDLADRIPDHPAEDREAINGARTQVVEAMAGVEAVAAELLPSPQRLLGTGASKLDLKA